MLTCVGFFFNPGTAVYGAIYGVINFFGAGAIFTGSLFAFYSPKKWILWTLIITMSGLILFNSVWFMSHGVFMTTGFPLIAYDLLFVVVNFHFLGKGL